MFYDKVELISPLEDGAPEQACIQARRSQIGYKFAISVFITLSFSPVLLCRQIIFPQATKENGSILLLAAKKSEAIQRILKLPNELTPSAAIMDDQHGNSRESSASADQDDEERKVEQAECAIAIVDAVTAAAKAGVNINAAAKTCSLRSNESLLPGVPRGQQNSFTKSLCPVNAEFSFVSFSGVAVSIAGAVASCGEAANVDAVCAEAIIGIIESLVDISASSQIIATTCGRRSLSSRSHWAGSGATPRDDVRHMSKNDSAQAPRRLYLGGGSASMKVQCGLDVLDASLALAKLGVVLRNAIVLAACAGVDIPEDTLETLEALAPGSAKSTQEIYRANCATDVLAVLLEVTKATSFLSLTSIHCPPKLNLPAVCATGNAALISGIAGVGDTSAGMFIVCNQLPLVEKRYKIIKARLLHRLVQLQGLQNDSNAYENISVDLQAIHDISDRLGNLGMSQAIDVEIGDLSTRRLQGRPVLHV